MCGGGGGGGDEGERRRGGGKEGGKEERGMSWSSTGAEAGGTDSKLNELMAAL